MIKPIGANTNSFHADKTIDTKTGDYKDPLMRWPLRGAAFTNEVGEALRPVIGNYATLTWAPALLYIGADIYDKYKNENTEYQPDSRRALKQAIFQGLASVLLPVFAVKTGQNVFAQLGKLGKDKIGINTKEHVSKLAEQFVANGKMRAYDGKDAEAIKEFQTIVLSSMDFKHQKRSIKNFFKLSSPDNEQKISKYAEKTIKELIELRKILLERNSNSEIAKTLETDSAKWIEKYKRYIKLGQTNSVAVKSVLTEFQKKKMLNGSFIKTIGGFIALGLAIKPIDHFVEEILIGKYVGPQIDKYK